MLGWMLYVIMVTLLLSIGALLAERAARLNRGGTRWIWIVAIVGSLCIPVIADSLQDWLPAVVRPAAAPLDAMTPAAFGQALSPADWITSTAEQTPAWWRDSDTVLRWLCAGTSLALALALLGSWLGMALRARRWQAVVLAGVPVLVADDAGPAVMGLLRPRIVLPRWMTHAPRAQQAAILAHERSHLVARDPQLFSLALALLVFMPWNLPLWWQLRSLRRAIEIDCDARVVASGIDASSYAEALISAGEHRSAHIGALAATGSRSFLEQRLRIMFSKPVKWRRSATAAFAALSLGLTALAAQVSPPAASATSSTAAAPADDASPARPASASVKLPATTLDRYVGDFAQGDSIFYKVRRDGDHLVADSSAGPRLELLPEGEDHFFVLGGDAKVIFANDGSGKAPSAVLRQMGRDLPLARVAPAAVAQFEANLQARLRSQAAAPGTEAALRSFLNSLDAGTPGYASMQPLLAEAVRRDLPRFVAAGRQSGPIESIHFEGVDGGGWDVYDVQRTHSRTKDRIILAGDGTISGYFSTEP